MCVLLRWKLFSSNKTNSSSKATKKVSNERQIKYCFLLLLLQSTRKENIGGNLTRTEHTTNEYKRFWFVLHVCSVPVRIYTEVHNNLDFDDDRYETAFPLKFII